MTARRGRSLTREQALAELTRRYFRSHGPATVNDFTWWSSLTVADARAGLEAASGELVHEVDDGGTSWFSAAAPSGPLDPTGALLLPGYDEAVIAYKDLNIVLVASPPREGPDSSDRPRRSDGRELGAEGDQAGGRHRSDAVHVAERRRLASPLGRCRALRAIRRLPGHAGGRVHGGVSATSARRPQGRRIAHMSQFTHRREEVLPAQ